MTATHFYVHQLGQQYFPLTKKEWQKHETFKTPLNRLSSCYMFNMFYYYMNK